MYLITPVRVLINPNIPVIFKLTYIMLIRPDQISLLLLGFAGPIFVLVGNLNTHARCRPLTKYYGTLTFITCN